MQSTIGNTVDKAKRIATDAMSDKKQKDMKTNFREQQTDQTPLTSDTGVKQPSHDIWLSASTGDRQGPQLLEDNYSREKV